MYYGLLSLAAKVPASGYDSDAQAFFTATGITDTTQKSAVNQLVLDLKSYSIWTKLLACYPFVGGTSTTHKYNLKDPQDTDAAFRLVFSGGWTHSSTGALPNGTNAYADTKLASSAHLSQDSASYGMYSRTEANGEYYDMGSAGLGSRMLLRFNGSFYHLNNDTAFDTGTNSSSLGLFVSSRTGSTTKKGYRNATEIQNSTRSSTGLDTNNFYLGSYTSSSGFTIREFAFAFIGSGLDATEVSNLSSAVTTFQTTLSRNV